MARFFCPGCWKDFREDQSSCPYCGLDIPAFWDSLGFVEKLILALSHPEPTTPIRAAWLLGKLKDKRAVVPLTRLIEISSDIYVVRAAISALGEINTQEARVSLEGLANHPDKHVRDRAPGILALTNDHSHWEISLHEQERKFHESKD